MSGYEKHGVEDAGKNAVPGGLVALPLSLLHRIEDADEELMPLYAMLSMSSGEVGLGCIESRNDVLEVSIDIGTNEPSSQQKSGRRSRQEPAWSRAQTRELHLTIHQNVRSPPFSAQLTPQCTKLRTDTGDTGSVAWKSSFHFAQHLLRYLWGRTDTNLPTLFHLDRLTGSRVLEIGAGTGILAASLFTIPDWLPSGRPPLHYLATDQSKNIPLLHKNLDPLHDPLGRFRLHVDELNWRTYHDVCKSTNASRLVPRLLQDTLTPLWGESESLEYPDLILSVDCVYNPSLYPELLSTIELLCAPRHTVVLCVVQLRAYDCVHEFLDSWLQSGRFAIHALDESVFPASVRQGWVAWLAWRTS